MGSPGLQLSTDAAMQEMQSSSLAVHGRAKGPECEISNTFDDLATTQQSLSAARAASVRSA